MLLVHISVSIIYLIIAVPEIQGSLVTININNSTLKTNQF